MSNGNAGTEITMDSVLHSRIPYANPLSSIKELTCVKYPHQGPYKTAMFGANKLYHQHI